MEIEKIELINDFRSIVMAISPRELKYLIEIARFYKENDYPVDILDDSTCDFMDETSKFAESITANAEKILNL